jgi:hypothetical protein
MYANLKVSYDRQGDQETVYAWKIDLDVSGRQVVHIDAQDGSGSYAEPNGEIVLDPAGGDRLISVEASF